MINHRAIAERIRSLLAQDAGEKWITVNGGSRSGGEGGGSHVMIDSEGRVIAGMGGKFTGVKIDDIPRENFINEGAYKNITEGYTGSPGMLARSTEQSRVTMTPKEAAEQENKKQTQIRQNIISGYKTKKGDDRPSKNAYMQALKESRRADFFGGDDNVIHMGNNRVRFKPEINDHEVCLVTSDLRYNSKRESAVMLTSNNGVIFIKDFHLVSIPGKLNSHIVRVNLDKVKEYTYKDPHYNFHMTEQDRPKGESVQDYLRRMAKNQTGADGFSVATYRTGEDHSVPRAKMSYQIFGTGDW